MERIYVFLVRNDIWIYILCALGLIWYLSELWRSRRMLRSAMFGLEKEKGQRLQRRALFFIIIFAGIAGIVFYVNNSIAPTLPAELLKPPTPTPNIFATPLSSPTPDSQFNSTPTLGIAPTVTLPNLDNSPPPTEAVDNEEDSGQPVQNPENTETLAGCTEDVNITAPPSGTSVSGSFSVFGTANIEELGSYELEANGPQTGGTWLPILGGAGTFPVFEDILGDVDLSNWLPGPYLIRLTVLDDEGIPVGQCPAEIQLQPATS